MLATNSRVTLLITMHSDCRHIVVQPSARPEPRSADFALNIERHAFTDQRAAEHFADGVAAGLRACGHSVEIKIDLPSEDDADLLDFASFDAWAQERGEAQIAGPEVDAVSARLARDVEAGHYRAQALGL